MLKELRIQFSLCLKTSICIIIIIIFKIFSYSITNANSQITINSCSILMVLFTKFLSCKFRLRPYNIMMYPFKILFIQYVMKYTSFDYFSNYCEKSCNLRSSLQVQVTVRSIIDIHQIFRLQQVESQPCCPLG